MNQIEKNNPGTVFLAWSGKKQTGKDTATAFAKTMLEKEGKRVAVTAFAEALKDIVINVLGVPHHLAYGTNAEKEVLTTIYWDTLPIDIRLKYSINVFEWNGEAVPRSGPMTVRELMQVLGTDIFRHMLENDVWAHTPFRKNWKNYDVVIITDCRFLNEKAITELNDGIVIRLERDTGFQDNHPSETSLDGVQFQRCYINNGTLQDLENFVRETLIDIKLIS